jgi:hypothetical protein
MTNGLDEKGSVAAMQFLEDKLLMLVGRLPAFDSQAVLYAFIAGLITGWAWYAVAGSVWKASISATQGFHSPRRYIFSAIAQIIMTIMLAIMVAKLGETTMAGGLRTAIMLWFGFVMTTTLVNYANIGQKLIVSIVDGIHWLLVLAVMGIVIGTFSAAQPEAAGSAPAVQPAPAATTTTGSGG